MDQALDAIVSMTIFLCGFIILSIVFSSSLNGLLAEMAGVNAPVKVIRLAHHFSILKVDEGLYMVLDSEGAKGVWVRCFVIKPDRSWYVVEGVTPLLVRAGERDWIVALSYSGWGLKTGSPVNEVITLYGLLKPGKTLQTPYVTVNGTEAYVKPPELLYTPGGVRLYRAEPIGRLVYRRIRIVAYVPMLEEGYSS